MNAILELHHKSLELSDEAFVAHTKGNENSSRILYEKAFWLEKEAALQMPLNGKTPVPRPVFLRSAASLAFKAGLFQEAEKLIALCRAENPPAFVVRELSELEVLITQQKPATQNGHLEIKGKLTSANEHENEIMVEETTTRRAYSIFIPAGKLKDVVRSFFSEMVFVQASASPHGMFTLEKISRAA